tara:strand:- start:1320 stop:1994 length:675 start_codon:yes stop_codon:yes gene_type:complete
MDIDESSYLGGIKYADWVKADSQFDYQPYIDAHGNYGEMFDYLPQLTLTLTKPWALALKSSDELRERWMNGYWEWAFDYDGEERHNSHDLRGIGFYANKFIVFVFDLNITSRNWNERKESYGPSKTQYGARVEMLKYPIKKTKKDLTLLYEADKRCDFDDYIVASSIDSSYEVAPTLKGLKKAVKRSICRLIVRQQGLHAYDWSKKTPLFPLSYGFVNFKELKQ